MDIEEKVKERYPGAVPVKGFFDGLDSEIEKTGFNPHQTLTGLCVCRDDNNREIRRECLFRYKAGYFSLETLAGIPSLPGITAYKAMAHHIPEEGMAAVLVLPHIGISKNGVYGEVERIGQSRPSPDCGAIVGCIKSIINSEPAETSDNPEFCRLMDFLSNQNIPSNFSSAVLEATERVYSFAVSESDRILSIVKKEYHSPVLRVTGIIINTAKQDYIQLRDVKIIK